ncbi:hypothetical protein T492DRAFT_872837 [Pavlovales sp. CCMP2436]|nr:hypothetical protein T492DRAFT_872837 [Pavlovales sp. CCMP2436]
MQTPERRASGEGLGGAGGKLNVTNAMTFRAGDLAWMSSTDSTGTSAPTAVLILEVNQMRARDDPSALSVRAACEAEVVGEDDAGELRLASESGMGVIHLAGFMHGLCNKRRIIELPGVFPTLPFRVHSQFQAPFCAVSCYVAFMVDGSAARLGADSLAGVVYAVELKGDAGPRFAYIIGSLGEEFTAHRFYEPADLPMDFAPLLKPDAFGCRRWLAHAGRELVIGWSTTYFV